MTLTSKQDAFVQGKLVGLNNSDAYRQAYDADNMSSEAIQVESSRLMDHPMVALCIEETRSANRAWDLDRVVDELSTNVKLGRELKQIAASNGAIVSIGKAVGVITDKLEVAVTHTIKPGLTLEELEARYQRIEALEAGMVTGSNTVEGEVVTKPEDIEAEA
jgi:acetylornithine deacetylase/succinyl-diaminopimelate desuccinylase-like protein